MKKIYDIKTLRITLILIITLFLTIFSYPQIQNKTREKGIKVKLEFKKYSYCDEIRDALFIKIKNETNKKVYLMNYNPFEYFVEIYCKGDNNYCFECEENFNTFNYYQSIRKCKEYIKDSFSSFEDYNNWILKSINNPNHFQINQNQIDSLSKKSNPLTFPNKFLFLDVNEEYDYIYLIDYIKESSDYKPTDSIKVIYNYDNIIPKKNIPKLPKTIFGYSRWEKDLKSDTLMIKLE